MRGEEKDVDSELEREEEWRVNKRDRENAMQ